jgi:hypothetical protein
MKSVLPSLPECAKALPNLTRLRSGVGGVVVGEKLTALKCYRHDEGRFTRSAKMVPISRGNLGTGDRDLCSHNGERIGRLSIVVLCDKFSDRTYLAALP